MTFCLMYLVPIDVFMYNCQTIKLYIVWVCVCVSVLSRSDSYLSFMRILTFGDRLHTQCI